MIKVSKVLKRVEKLGKKHPKRMRSFVYFKDNSKPCCIVGHALRDLGVNVKSFLEDVDLNSSTDVKELFLYHSDELGLKIDSVEKLVRLKEIQVRQDAGYTWGEAVA